MEKLTELNFVNEAESVIKSLIKEDRRGRKVLKPSNSQIRNLLELTGNLYARVKRERAEKLNEELQSDIQYVKMKFAYAAGREKDVREFVTRAKLLERLDNINDSKAELVLFCKYMESLVAYHKFHGGEK